MTRNDEGKVVEVQCGQRYCTDVVRLPNEGGIMVVSSVYPRVVAPKVGRALETLNP
jgi:hypothetical protein